MISLKASIRNVWYDTILFETISAPGPVPLNGILPSMTLYLSSFDFSGYYCPTGSDAPRPCAAGTFTNLTKTITCTTCPEAYYCPLNTSYPIECPAGYWCPVGSEEPHANPCAAGKFNNLTARSAVSACLNCPPSWVAAFIPSVAESSTCFCQGDKLF